MIYLTFPGTLFKISDPSTFPNSVHPWMTQGPPQNCINAARNCTFVLQERCPMCPNSEIWTPQIWNFGGHQKIKYSIPKKLNTVFWATMAGSNPWGTPAQETCRTRASNWNTYGAMKPQTVL